MPYLIDATDKDEAADLRERVRPEHLDYLVAQQGRLLAAGAKLDDSGKAASGSLYILDTDSRAEAEAFIAADPFSRAGLFGTVVIQRWRKGFFNFQRQPVSGS
jgi:uncharacterized protein YciI